MGRQDNYIQVLCHSVTLELSITLVEVDLDGKGAQPLTNTRRQHPTKHTSSRMEETISDLYKTCTYVYINAIVGMNSTSDKSFTLQFKSAPIARWKS